MNSTYPEKSHRRTVGQRSVLDFGLSGQVFHVFDRRYHSFDYSGIGEKGGNR